jgi:phosphoglycerate kinase
MGFPELTNLEIDSKKVLLRADLDVDNPEGGDLRIRVAAETIKTLISKGAKVIVIGHKGRPEGKIDKQFSLGETAKVLSELIEKDIKFIFDIVGQEAMDEAAKLESGQVLMLENLRFDSREESNDEEFSKALSRLGEVYVNEAFGVSHRNHASIVGIPKHIPGAIGTRFVKEVWNLSKVTEEPKRPLLFIVSGLKEDKLNYVKKFEEYADKILIGGRLPELMGDKSLESIRLQTGKVLIGNLVMDKEDITLNTVDVFENEIQKAATIVVSGPLGKFEDPGHSQGTQKVYEAVARSSAFKIAGGGDTEAAIKRFMLEDKFDWVSVGGGAMLEFLSSKTLPGLEAVIK